MMPYVNYLAQSLAHSEGFIKAVDLTQAKNLRNADLVEVESRRVVCCRGLRRGWTPGIKLELKE